MSDITIRPVRADEFDRLGELTVRAYQADGYVRPDSHYRGVLRDVADRVRHAEVLVAVGESDELLGGLTVVRPGSKYSEVGAAGELEFRMLAVDEAARGRGVGEALVRAVLDRAAELDVARVVLCSLYRMRPAHRLYERLGFTRMPERDWEPEPDAKLLAYGIPT